MHAVRSLVATLAALAALCVPAHAQEALTAEKRADMQQLLDMTGALAVGQRMSELMVPQMLQIIRSAQPDISDRIVGMVETEINATIQENLPAFTELIFPIYHRHFTHEDIRGMIEFYRTDLGRKTIRVLPLVMRDSMIAGQRWGETLGPEVERRVRQKLAGEGIKL